MQKVIINGLKFICKGSALDANWYIIWNSESSRLSFWCWSTWVDERKNFELCYYCYYYLSCVRGVQTLGTKVSCKNVSVISAKRGSFFACSAATSWNLLKFLLKLMRYAPILPPSTIWFESIKSWIDVVLTTYSVQLLSCYCYYGCWFRAVNWTEAVAAMDDCSSFGFCYYMLIWDDYSFQVLSMVDWCGCLCCWWGLLTMAADDEAWSRICTFAASLISLAMLASWCYCCWLRMVKSGTSCWQDCCLVKLPLIRSVVRDIFPSIFLYLYCYYC